jgi:hypothetical protein
MTCKTAHDRLLADPADAGADVRMHLASCPACAAMRARLRAIDGLVRAVPVPDRTPAKAAFLATLQSRVVVPSSFDADRRSLGRAYLTAAVLAASVLIAVGTSSLWPKQGQIAKTSTTTAPAHALLAQSVAFASEQAALPANRKVASAMQFAGHLINELDGIHLAAGPDDVELVRVVGDLVNRTLTDGLADGQLPANPLERRTLLDPLMSGLAAMTEATRAMALNAPVHARPALNKLEADLDRETKRLVALGARPASPTARPAPAGANAGTELALLRKNRAIIEILADRGLKAGRAGDAIDRIEELRGGVQALEAALATAVADGDTDRMAELGDRLATAWGDGLTPAWAAIGPGHDNPESPSHARMMAMKAKLKADAERARAALPSRDPRLETVRRKLQTAAKFES